MKTIKQELSDFMNENFDAFKIRISLYGSHKYGLRFELGIEDLDSEEYFNESIKRAISLFEACFSPDNNIYFVYSEYKWKRRKIRKGNYIFKQISNLKNEEIIYKKANRLHENDKRDIRNFFILKLEAKRINYKNILMAIANMDFGSRSPRIELNTEIFFINIDRKLIMNMYDDRGLDIIASKKETLLPIYKDFNDWILDYNRDEIDRIFKSY